MRGCLGATWHAGVVPRQHPSLNARPPRVPNTEYQPRVHRVCAARRQLAVPRWVCCCSRPCRCAPCTGSPLALRVCRVHCSPGSQHTRLGSVLAAVRHVHDGRGTASCAGGHVSIGHRHVCLCGVDLCIGHVGRWLRGAEWARRRVGNHLHGTAAGVRVAVACTAASALDSLSPALGFAPGRRPTRLHEPRP